MDLPTSRPTADTTSPGHPELDDQGAALEGRPASADDAHDEFDDELDDNFDALAMFNQLRAASPADAEPADPVPPTEHPDIPATGTAADGANAGANDQVPAQAPTQASAETAEPAASEDRPRPPGRGIYLRRQAKLVGTAAAIIAAALAIHHHGIPGAAPDVTAQSAAMASQDAHTIPGAAEARSDQDRATAYYRHAGTMSGLHLTGPGLRYATNGTTLVASRLTDHVCVMYAVTGTHRTQVQVDASGVACTDAEIRSTHAALHASDTAARTSAVATADSLIKQVATVAAQYATTTWSHGAPSLAGLPADLVTGTRILTNAGTYVDVVATSSTACREARIHTDGTIDAAHSCS